jgi:predicted nucleotidyltransferase
MKNNIDIENYVKGWRERIERERHQIDTRYLNARKTIPIIIEILKKYDVEKIILFGSICQREDFHKHSDIDIAVVGLQDQFFFKAFGELMMKLDFEIDLKPYEQLDLLMKDRILKKGEVIYVRKK